MTWGMPFGKTPLVANLEGVLKVLDGEVMGASLGI